MQHIVVRKKIDGDENTRVNRKRGKELRAGGKHEFPTHMDSKKKGHAR